MTIVIDSDYANNCAQLIDVIGKSSDILETQVRYIPKIRKVRRYHQRRRAQLALGQPPRTLLDLLTGDEVMSVIVRQRDAFVNAIRSATRDELSRLAQHGLLDGSFEMSLKYAAFHAAHTYFAEVADNGGPGLTPSAEAWAVVKAGSPALEITNAIVGSAMHAFPLAGGVYKEGKDNFEAIVDFVGEIPGAAKAVGGAVVKGAKRVGRKIRHPRKKKERAEVQPVTLPLTAIPEEEGPAPAP